MGRMQDVFYLHHKYCLIGFINGWSKQQSRGVQPELLLLLLLFCGIGNGAVINAFVACVIVFLSQK